MNYSLHTANCFQTFFMQLFCLFRLQLQREALDNARCFSWDTVMQSFQESQVLSTFIIHSSTFCSLESKFHVES